MPLFTRDNLVRGAAMVDFAYATTNNRGLPEGDRIGILAALMAQGHPPHELCLEMFPIAILRELHDTEARYTGDSKGSLWIMTDDPAYVFRSPLLQRHYPAWHGVCSGYALALGLA
jgi:hypothetical protein